MDTGYANGNSHAASAAIPVRASMQIGARDAALAARIWVPFGAHVFALFAQHPHTHTHAHNCKQVKATSSSSRILRARASTHKFASSLTWKPVKLHARAQVHTLERIVLGSRTRFGCCGGGGDGDSATKPAEALDSCDAMRVCWRAILACARTVAARASTTCACAPGDFQRLPRNPQARSQASKQAVVVEKQQQPPRVQCQ